MDQKKLERITAHVAGIRQIYTEAMMRSVSRALYVEQIPVGIIVASQKAIEDARTFARRKHDAAFVAGRLTLVNAVEELPPDRFYIRWEDIAESAIKAK